MGSTCAEDSNMEEVILNLEDEQTVCMQADQVMFLCVDCSQKQLFYTHLYFCEKCIDSSAHHDHQVIQTDNNNYAERCSCGDSELIDQNSYCSCDSSKSSSSVSSAISQTQISAFKAYCFQQFTRIFRALEKAELEPTQNQSSDLTTQMEDFFLQMKVASLKQPSLCASILTSSLPQFQTTHLCSSLIFDPSQKFFMKPCSCTVLENLFRHEKATEKYNRTIISNVVRHRPFVFQLAKLFSKALISQAGFIRSLANMLKDMLEKFRQSDFEDHLNDQGHISTLFSFIFTRELEVDERIVLTMCEIVSNSSPRDFLPINPFHEEMLIVTENMNFELISQLLRALLKNCSSANNKVLDNLIYVYTTKCQCDIAMISPEDTQDPFNRTASRINSYRSPFFQGNVSVFGLLLSTAFVLVYESLPPKAQNTNLGDLESAKEKFKEYAMRVSHLSSKGIELLASGIITRMAKDMFEVLRLAQYGDSEKQQIVQSFWDRLWSRDICSIQVLSMLLPGELLVDSVMRAMSNEQTVDEQVMCLKLFDWIGNSDVCFVRSVAACFVKEMRFLKELKTSICVQLFYGRDQCPLASLRSRLKQYLNPSSDSQNYRSQLEAPWAVIPVVINNQDRSFDSDNSLEDQLYLFATLSTSHVTTLLPVYQSRYAIIDNYHHSALSQESFTYLKEKHLDVILGNMIPGLHRHFLAAQMQDSRKLKLFLSRILTNASPLDKSFQLSLKLLSDMILFNQHFTHLVIAPASPLDPSAHTRAASQPLNFISPEKKNISKKVTSKMSFTSSPLLEQFEEFIGERAPLQAAKKERSYGLTSSKIILCEVGIKEPLIGRIRNELKQQNEESLSLQKSFEMFVETVHKFGLISSEDQQGNPEKDQQMSNSSEQEKQKLKAAERQKAILDQFSSKQKQFQAQNQSALVKTAAKNENTAECAICRTEETILIMRAYVDIDNIINYLNVADIEDLLPISNENAPPSDDDSKNFSSHSEKQQTTQYSISACQHLAHLKCHEEGSANMQIGRHALNKQEKESQLETFCTICKGLSNIAIPVLDSIVVKPKFQESYGNYLRDVKGRNDTKNTEKVKAQTKKNSNNKTNNLKERVKLAYLEMQDQDEKSLQNAQVASAHQLTQVQNGVEELLSILAIIVSDSEEDQLNTTLTSELHLFGVINSLLSSLLLQSLMATNMQQFQTKYWKLLENLYLNSKLIFKRQNSSETDKWATIQQTAEKTLRKYINSINNNESYQSKEEELKPVSFLLGFCRNIFQIVILSGEAEAVKFSMKFLQRVILIQSRSYLKQNDLDIPENQQNLSDGSKTMQDLQWLWSANNSHTLDIQINCLPYFRLVSVFLQLLGSFEASTLFKLNPPNDLDPEAELEGICEAFGKEFITLDLEYMVTKLPLNIDDAPSCRFFSFGDKVFELFQLPKNFDEFYRKQFWKKCSIEKSFPRITESPLIVCLICGVQICSQREYEGEQEDNDLRHVDENHAGVGAFIQLCDSRVVLVDRMSKQNSNFLYADKFNRPAHCLGHTNWKDYLLDTQAFNELYQMIIQRRIPQQIRYILMQKEDDPFYFSDDEDNDD